MEKLDLGYEEDFGSRTVPLRSHRDVGEFRSCYPAAWPAQAEQDRPMCHSGAYSLDWHMEDGLYWYRWVRKSQQ